MTVVLIDNTRISNVLTQIVFFNKTPELHGADEQATFVIANDCRLGPNQICGSAVEYLTNRGVCVAVPYIIGKYDY